MYVDGQGKYDRVDSRSFVCFPRGDIAIIAREKGIIYFLGTDDHGQYR